MKLRPARRKKYCKLGKNNPFPLLNNEERNTRYTGRFNGFCVTINNLKQMDCINAMGFFGKGNLSRSFPNFNEQRKPSIIRRRQHENRKRLGNIRNIIPEGKLSETVIILNDSDSENEDLLNNSKPELVHTLLLTETLNLSLEEAFFLSNFLNCLNIYDFNDKLLRRDTIWELFAKTQPNFIQNYIVYHYFRSRKWVVKSGLKFGGDFLLYKQGPPFFHASYLVVVSVIYKDKVNMNPTLFEWVNLIGLNRLSETAAKEVIICQVIWPAGVLREQATKSSDVIKLFSVNTILMRRWIAKHERKSKD